MIADYTRPQLVIKQQLQKLPNAGSRVIGAFTLGPQFFLSRYTNAAERAKLTGVVFEHVTSTNEADWQVVPAENKLAHHVIDQSYTRLFAENLEGQLCVVQKPSVTLSEAVSSRPIKVKVLSLDQPNRLRFGNYGLVVTIAGTGAISGATLVAGGLGFAPNRSLTTGDALLVAVPGGTGGILRLATDAYGQVTAVSHTASGAATGSGYSAGTREISPTYAVANLKDADDADVPLHSGLRGRPVQVGDVVYVSHTDPNTTEIKTSRHTVAAIERDLVAASVGTVANDDGVGGTNRFAEDDTRNPATGSPALTSVTVPANWSAVELNSKARARDWNGMTQGSTFNGVYGERYTLVVTQSGTVATDGTGAARLRIRSLSGGFSADDVGAAATELVRVTDHSHTAFRVTHAALGGLVINLVPPSGVTTLTAGQIFAFTITGQYDGTHANYQNVLDPSTPRLVLNTSTTYGGPRNTRYVITVTKGVTRTFKAALFTLDVSGGALVPATTTILDGGYGYAPNKVEGDNYLVTIQGAAAGGVGTLKVATNAAGTITQIFPGGAGGTGYEDDEIAYGRPPAADRSTTPYTGAEIQVTDTAGIDRPQTYTVTHDAWTDLGTYGLQFKFNRPGTGDDPTAFNTGLRKGDVFYIDAVAAAATGPLGILVLSGQAADTTLWDSSDLANTHFEVEFRTLFTGEVPKKGHAAPNHAWAPSAAGVVVRNGLTIEVPSRSAGYTWVPVKEVPNDGVTTAYGGPAVGRLFCHWRGLVPAASGETIKFLRNEVDIKARFGAEDLDNPACMAALIAFRGSQGKGVYAARLATNDLAGYNAVLKQAERIDGIYAVAPASDDLDVQLAARAHVGKCSQDDWKLWRRTYVGLSSPGTYALLTVDADNSTLMGTVTANGSGNVVVTASGANFVSAGVRAGDRYRTSYGANAWGETTWTDYEILEVNTNDELILKAGPASPITPAIKFEIWRPDTGLSQAEFAGLRAQTFADRRVCVVWNDAPYRVSASGSLTVVPAYYLAAEIAGLRSALVQQQGLTYTELEHSLHKSPSMFTKFTQEELNLAAAKGVMIVTQESEDGPCFIRHQLTTKTTEGSLYYEDSVGYNLDLIAYGCKDVLQPFIGKQNATPERIDAIDTKLRTLFDSFKAARDGSIIGPALLNYSYLKKSGSVLVEIDPVLKDRINIGVDLELPLPINSITVSLNATTLQNETLAAA